MKAAWPTPQINQIVTQSLRYAARQRIRHAISEAEFRAAVSRIEGQHILPHGLSLIVRDLQDGTLRFLIKSEEGVCDMIDCNRERRKG